VTQQTLHLAALRGPDVVYIEKLRTSLAVPTPAVVGASLPAHLTAVGKSLMAAGLAEMGISAGALMPVAGRNLPDPLALARELYLTRARGYAIDRGNSVKGLACIAVLIVAGGSVVAALSVAFPAGAGTGEILVSSLRETATSIGRSVPPPFAGSLFQAAPESGTTGNSRC
jgi:DNA-binding IclR family transcriptional regulator